MEVKAIKECIECESEMKLLINKTITWQDETHVTYNIYYCPKCANVYGIKRTENSKADFHAIETFNAKLADIVDTQIHNNPLYRMWTVEKTS